MQHVIIIHNSPFFNVRMNALISSDRILDVIINPEAHREFETHHYGHLAHAVHVTDDFSYDNLITMLTPLLASEPPKDIRIVTDIERCMHVCGRLRDYFHVSGMKEREALIFVNKIAMKLALANANVRMPHFVEYTRTMGTEGLQEALCKVGLPMFIKPVSDTNSNHTRLVQTENELFQWDTMLQDDTLYELDEYIHGTMYHIDSLYNEGDITASFVCEYSHPPAEFNQGKPLGSITLPLKDPVVQELLDFNKVILNALGYKGPGVSHLEVFKTPQGYVFLEIAARAPGAWIPELYEKQYNFHYPTQNILSQLGHPLTSVHNDSGVFAAKVWMPTPTAIVRSLDLPSLKNKFILESKIMLGQKPIQPTRICNNAGSVLLWGNDFETLYEDFNKLTGSSIFFLDQTGEDDPS